MKIPIKLITKPKQHTLTFYQCALDVEGINELEVHDVLIFPIEMVYSVKQLLTIIHLALDNIDNNASMLSFKITVKNMFYNRKKAFRSYYHKYIIVFLDCDPDFEGKSSWDPELSDMKSREFTDLKQIRKTYDIKEKDLDTQENLDDYICTAINQQSFRNM